MNEQEEKKELKRIGDQIERLRKNTAKIVDRIEARRREKILAHGILSQFEWTFEFPHNLKANTKQKGFRTKTIVLQKLLGWDYSYVSFLKGRANLFVTEEGHKPAISITFDNIKTLGSFAQENKLKVSCQKLEAQIAQQREELSVLEALLSRVNK